jgi:hypothetical protein
MGSIYQFGLIRRLGRSLRTHSGSVLFVGNMDTNLMINMATAEGLLLEYTTTGFSAICFSTTFLIAAMEDDADETDIVNLVCSRGIYDFLRLYCP